MKSVNEFMSVGKLTNHFFIIPDYQREYVWDEKDVELFILDIENDYNDFKTETDDSDNYLGLIITSQRIDGDLEVIDGQQRLTTIVLLLIAIRNFLLNCDIDYLAPQYSELMKAIIDILIYYDPKSQHKKLRINLQYEDSHQYLNSLILNTEYKGNDTASIRKMRNAYNLLSGKIREFVQADIFPFVNYILSGVTMDLKITKGYKTAFKVFERLNNRGGSIDALDTLKNMIFQAAPVKDLEKIKVIWKDTNDNLEACQEGRQLMKFLRFFLMANYKMGLLKRADIYGFLLSAEIQQKIKTNAIGFAEEIKEASGWYKNFVLATKNDEDPDFPYLSEIGKISKKSIRQYIILLLALKKNLRSDKKAMDLLCENIESYIFYASMFGESVRHYDIIFSAWIKPISELNTLEDLKQFIKSILAPAI